MDYDSLDDAISSLSDQAEASAGNGRGWHEVWSAIKTISGHFRSVRYPSRSARDESWERFQSIVAAVKVAQERQRENAARSKESLERRIRDLKSLQQAAVNRSTPWKEFWSASSELYSELQSAHLLTKADRDKLWGQFRSIKAEAKDFAVTAQSEREAREQRSTSHRKEIAANIQGARPLTDLENLIADLILFLPKLAARMALSPFGLFEELDERRAELQSCSERMREAWNLFESYKNDMSGQDKREMFESLRKAQDTLDGAWEQHKQSRNDARNAAQEARAAKAAKHEAYLERVQANITKLEERRSKLNDIRDHKRAHLGDLRDKLTEARSESYRSRVEGWIEKEEDDIRNIEDQIAQVRGWLHEAREKLGTDGSGSASGIPARTGRGH